MLGKSPQETTPPSTTHPGPTLQGFSAWGGGETDYVCISEDLWHSSPDYEIWPHYSDSEATMLWSKKSWSLNRGGLLIQVMAG